MGLLDWLFGRRGAADGGADEGAELVGAAPRRMPTQPPGRIVVGPKSALEPLVSRLGAREVRRDPDDDDEYEVRGALDGRPARVKLDERPWMSCALKGSFGARALVLCRDPSKVPKRGDVDDPWDDGEIRAFVGKGIYAEGDREQVDGFLRILGGLSDASRAGLLRALARLFRDSPVVVFCAGGELVSLAGATIYAEAAAEAEEALAALLPVAAEIEAMPDPIQAMIAAAQAGAAAATAAVAPQVVSCEYCGSRYVVAWEYACPNCGAPYRG